MIISPENILTHVGQPDGFGANLIYSYVMDGYTVTTITIDYYREQNFNLYESVDFKITKK